MGLAVTKERPENTKHLTPDPLASTVELSQEQRACVWDGLNNRTELINSCTV